MHSTHIPHFHHQVFLSPNTNSQTMKVLLLILAAALLALCLNALSSHHHQPVKVLAPPPPPPEAPQQTGCCCECETPGKTPYDWFMDVLPFNLGVLVAQ
ncbi:uncharacterized protein LOC132185886 isoform X2 [Corylus avellana]|nr:uncharacterized protein LOC132185886 isoform X2 [Corylus avellana]